MSRVLVIAMVCWSASATAQEAPPGEAPSWSVGGGIGYGAPLLTTGATLSPPGNGSVLYGSGLGTVVGGTTGGAFLERSLSRSTWLILDFSGSYSTQSADGSDPDLWTKSASLMLGVRHVVSEGGLVDVSLWAGLGGSWYRTNTLLGLASDGTVVRWTGTSTGGFASAGFIAERKLLDALSVRLNLTVLQARYQRSRYEAAGVEPSEAHSLQGTVGLSPAIQLRLAF